MAVFLDRVWVDIATTGTGTVTFGGARPGHRTPAAAGAADGMVLPYLLTEGEAWEFGEATIGDSVTTATRAVEKSSNSDNPIDLQGGATWAIVPLSKHVANLSAEDQVVSGGARVTVKDLGTVSSGTVTPDPGDRALQKYINDGAHTLAPGTNHGMYMLDIANGASAGAITISGWTKVVGSAFTTTNGHKFRCHCSITGDGSLLIIQALQ